MTDLRDVAPEALENELAHRRNAPRQIEPQYAARIGLDNGSTSKPEQVFTGDLLAELRKARTKFPYNGAGVVALMEEVGELAKAMLDESPEAIYREAVQVATMAMRAALEGDPSLDDYRLRHQGVDATPARGKRP